MVQRVIRRTLIGKNFEKLHDFYHALCYFNITVLSWFQFSVCFAKRFLVTSSRILYILHHYLLHIGVSLRTSIKCILLFSFLLGISKENINNVDFRSVSSLTKADLTVWPNTSRYSYQEWSFFLPTIHLTRSSFRS